MLQLDLEIPRGATFYGRGWALIDRQGQPIRDLADIDVQAKVRRYAGDDSALHVFATRAVLMLLPGHYDELPVAVALIDEIPHTETVGWDWSAGVWDLQVNHEPPIVGGLVSAPLVVSR